MRPFSPPVGTVTFALAVCLMLSAHARVDVTVEFDKTFDFKSVRTWAWNPERPGDVKMARTQSDDPDALRARAEPVILEAVASEMGRRGLKQDATADVTVSYYLLVSTTISAQTVGQFVPAVTDWGLPPFPPATQSLKIMDTGSLVLDLSAQDRIMWRGLARAKVKLDATAAAREALLREAVRGLLRRFPPRR